MTGWSDYQAGSRSPTFQKRLSIPAAIAGVIPSVLCWRPKAERLSSASYEDFADWLKLVLRKVKRSILDSERGAGQGEEGS